LLAGGAQGHYASALRKFAPDSPGERTALRVYTSCRGVFKTWSYPGDSVASGSVVAAAVGIRPAVGDSGAGSGCLLGQLCRRYRVTRGPGLWLGVVAGRPGRAADALRVGVDEVGAEADQYERHDPAASAAD